jgi:hypothetical protein
VVILIHFFDLAAALHFDFAHQAVRAVPIIGGEWFPAVDGHAAQGAVATVAKCFVPFGLVDDLLDRCTDSVQMQFIQNVGDDVGAERLHILLSGGGQSASGSRFL